MVLRTVEKRPSVPRFAGFSVRLTLSATWQGVAPIRRDAIRPSHKLDGVTKSCDLFVTTSPPHPRPVR
jgi:hypothetical protein